MHCEYTLPPSTALHIESKIAVRYSQPRILSDSWIQSENISEIIPNYFLFSGKRLPTGILVVTTMKNLA